MTSTFVPISNGEILKKIVKTLGHVSASFTKDESNKLETMSRMGYDDTILNTFKLIIYEWKIDEAIKHYRHDHFCHLYCIDETGKYGCQSHVCRLKHTRHLTLKELIWKENESYARFLCLYFMYTSINKLVACQFDDNAELYRCYGHLLTHGISNQNETRQEKQQRLRESGKYFLKSLDIDNSNADTHTNYAMLLEDEFKDYDKAEKHYKLALENDPNNVERYYSFGSFLIDHAYDIDTGDNKKCIQALEYCNRACVLAPNDSYAHYIKGQALYHLKIYDKAVKELNIAITIEESDHKLEKKTNDGGDGDNDNNDNDNDVAVWIDDAQYTIETCLQKIAGREKSKEKKIKSKEKHRLNGKKKMDSINCNYTSLVFKDNKCKETLKDGNYNPDENYKGVELSPLSFGNVSKLYVTSTNGVGEKENKKNKENENENGNVLKHFQSNLHRKVSFEM